VCYILIIYLVILSSNPHWAGLASLHRDEGGFMVAEIHYIKNNLSGEVYIYMCICSIESTSLVNVQKVDFSPGYKFFIVSLQHKGFIHVLCNN
jgi:hypothetical protein